jgi:hypothetical protein
MRPRLILSSMSGRMANIDAIIKRSICGSSCAQVYIYIYMRQCVYRCKCRWIYTCKYRCIYIYKHTHTHSYAYTHTYIHTHIYIYICTYTFGIYVPTCIIKTSIRLGDVCLETRWMHVPLLIAIWSEVGCSFRWRFALHHLQGAGMADLLFVWAKTMPLRTPAHQNRADTAVGSCWVQSCLKKWCSMFQ